MRLAVDTERVDPDWLWLHHKTNRREIYEAARARHRNVDDIVLVNSHGRITETTIATIALHLETAGGLRR